MALSEAARNDLYTGLTEVLGPTRTEILMSALPIHDRDEAATRGDVDLLRVELRDLRDAYSARLDSLDERLGLIQSELGTMSRSIDARLDTMNLSIDARLDTMNLSIDARLDTMNLSIDARLDTMNLSIDARLDRLFYLMVIVVLGVLAAITTMLVNL